MRLATAALLFLAFLPFSFAGCIPFSEAPQHVGETRCIKGKVLHIDESQPGFQSLSFCDSGEGCAFTVLVPAADQDTIASLRKLRGKTIKLHGLVKESNGEAQMVLDSKQLSPENSEMPSFMKTYDVEERGHYSAGTSHAPKSKRVYTKKQTATMPADIPEDPEDTDSSQ
ncbi:MAG: hypothetical protein ACRD2U_07295 [Terriglobales bacterium]